MISPCRLLRHFATLRTLIDDAADMAMLFLRVFAADALRHFSLFAVFVAACRFCRYLRQFYAIMPPLRHY